MRTVVSTTLVCLALLLPCGPARADVYVWKDDNGVVHMTDRKPSETNGKVEVLSQPGSSPAGSPAASAASGAPGAPVRKGAREERIAQMQKAALAHPRFAEL